MRYEHRQSAPLHLILLALAVGFLVLAWVLPGQPVVVIPVLAVTALTLVVAACFASLTIRDEGDCLAVRYGPLPLVSRRIPYAQIVGVETARSDWLDGWGAHWIPGRGWIYNLWGFDCVRLDLGGKYIRLGTDDLEGLVQFLAERQESP